MGAGWTLAGAMQSDAMHEATHRPLPVTHWRARETNARQTGPDVHMDGRTDGRTDDTL